VTRDERSAKRFRLDGVNSDVPNASSRWPFGESSSITTTLRGGVMSAGNTIKMKPENTVLKIEAGEKIQSTRRDFQKPSDTFFADLQAKFT
jgi:hypothetical protein